MSQWQPIETAPKDSEILGWDGMDRGVYYFSARLGCWLAHGDELDYYGPPTHWMPLPEPPDGPAA